MRVKISEKANDAAKLTIEKLTEQVSRRNEMIALLNSPQVSMFWKLFIEEDVDVRLEKLSIERAANLKTMSHAEFITNASIESIMKTYKAYKRNVELARDGLIKERNEIIKRINERNSGNKS